MDWLRFRRYFGRIGIGDDLVDAFANAKWRCSCARYVIGDLMYSKENDTFYVSIDSWFYKIKISHEHKQLFLDFIYTEYIPQNLTIFNMSTSHIKGD